jgi:hypothetical protein
MAWGKSTNVRKYRPGVRILGIFEMIVVLDAGKYVFVRGRAYHPAVLNNWSLGSLKSACLYSDARIAELTPEWIAAEEMKPALASKEAPIPSDVARNRVSYIEAGPELTEGGEKS